MFEWYTEQARRVVFFAHYEASQFGSDGMEPEHFLLALFREDPGLMNRFVPGTTGEMVREQVQRETPLRPKISTSVDMPLSHAAKRALAFGAEEAERMGHRHIGTEHLLLGLLREPTLAARILERLGVTLERAREQIAESSGAADPQPLSLEEAIAEREVLSSLIASLPDDALRRARSMLEHLQKFPGRQPGFPPPPIADLRQRMLERTGQMGSGFVGAGAGGGWLQEGHFSSSSMENGTMIFETRRIHKGHRIRLIERVRVSDDGKTLHYSQELRGPKGEHSWSMDFDIT
jgi:hypothetical protein